MNERRVSMNQVKEKYISYLDKKIGEYNRICEIYKAEDRKDEADFEKIKANICDIFKTLFIRDTKELEGKELSVSNNKNLYTNFLLRFDTIPANWKLSLAKAIAYGDVKKQVIEETKLAVAKELKEQFISILN
jgi:hypothetical protein